MTRSFSLALLALLLTSLALASRDPAQSPPSLKVMSFNIRFGTANDGENHWDKRKNFLAETIQTFAPDLLGTQETLASQRDFLAKLLPDLTPFAAGRDDGKDKGEMAALFWRKDRFDKLAGDHFWLSKTPDKVGSRGWDAALPRIVTWVKLRDKKAPDAKPLLFVNTHFDHRGKQARLESAKLLRERLLSLGKGCSLVLTGDFNAPEASDPYRTLFGPPGDKEVLLLDTYRVAHPKRGKDEGTFSGFQATSRSGGRIDWIGCSPDFKVLSATIDRTSRNGRTPSDHFPVTAILQR